METVLLSEHSPNRVKGELCSCMRAVDTSSNPLPRFPKVTADQETGKGNRTGREKEGRLIRNLMIFIFSFEDLTQEQSQWFFRRALGINLKAYIHDES